MVNGRYSPATVYWFRGLGGAKLGPRQVLLEEPGAKYSMATTNTGDLDRDGCLDLVIGDTSGKVFWSRNTGTAKAPKFGPRQPLACGAAPLKVCHKSDPSPADLDGDGWLDLLVGDETGDVVWFRGGSAPLQFEPGVSLFSRQRIDPAHGYAAAKQVLEPHRAVPGYRLRVTAVDWDRDGKLDLLLGNCETAGRRTIGNVYLLRQR